MARIIWPIADIPFQMKDAMFLLHNIMVQLHCLGRDPRVAHLNKDSYIIDTQVLSE